MFHWNNGWFFERLKDDSVHIIKRETARDDAPIISEAVIPVHQWASVIAAVSLEGDTAQTWEKALVIHGFTVHSEIEEH